MSKNLRIRPFGRLAAAALSAALFAGCSGGGGSAPVAPPLARTASPASGSLTLVFAKPSTAPAARHSLFLSPSAQSVSIAVTGIPAPVVADVTASSAACTATSTGRTCTIPLVAPPGSDTFTATLFDAPGATGKTLGTGSATLTVVSGTPFTVAIGVNGVTGSIVVSTALTSFVPGASVTTPVTVTVDDPDGNVISGTYAAPITLTLGDTSGAFTLSSSTVTSSTQAVTLTYDGAFTTATSTLTAAATGVPSSSITSQQLAVSEIAEYALPPGTNPAYLTTGPDGNAYTDTTAGLGKFDLKSFTFTPIAIPAGANNASGANESPDRLAPGPDGNVYYSDFGDSNIGSISPAGLVTEYTAPSTSNQSTISTTTQNTGIATGPDGNIWFSEANANAIGQFTIPGHAFTTFALPVAKSDPLGIVAGPDGALWFTEFNTSKIGRITTGGAITEFAVSAGAGPDMIAVGPDGNLWFTEYTSGKIGRITTAGAVTEFAVPSSASGPIQIVAGADGNLWFCEQNASQIGRITPAGVVTEFPTPSNISNPQGIAAGPDGDLYFTEVSTSKIGRFDPTKL